MSLGKAAGAQAGAGFWRGSGRSWPSFVAIALSIAVTCVGVCARGQAPPKTPAAPAAAAPATAAPATSAPAPTSATAAAPPGTLGDPGTWPRTLDSGGTTFTVYQPQLISWDGYRLKATAAVMAQENGQEARTFGSIQLEAKGLVDKDERTVTLEKVGITQVKFPSAGSKAKTWQKALNDAAAKADASIRTYELDRLETSLDIAKVKDKATRNVKNDPPRIIFSNGPSVLIYIDGTPIWRAVEGTSLQRVLNTRPLIVRMTSGTHYLRIFNGWVQASALQGPWSVSSLLSTELEAALQKELAAKTIDPLTGMDPQDPNAQPPSLKTYAPRIIVATQPSELIVTEGAPKYVPIPGTDLLYVENTTGNVFKHSGDQQTYVLLAGRWFKAPSEQGPWTFVPGDKLPKDFAAIPDDSPKENVKATVPGTAQAEEAIIANSVPQTAKVDRSKATFKPQIDGEPRFAPIESTTLSYVVNSPTPIIRVDDKTLYAVENGVWFTASSLAGPWVVAALVPAAIYGIPVTSPIHYVTYVQVYDATPTTVVVGYTPGYYGTYVSGGCVVYGTGYYYTPWVGSVWYGPPVTYGYGVNIAYTPWTGWSYGFGYGWSWGSVHISYGGWGWGPYPYWGPVGWGFYSPLYYPWAYRPGYGAVWGPRPGAGAVWGPGGWAASSGNVYHRWGSTAAVTRSSAGYDAWSGTGWSQQVGRSYNSRTGTLAAGQRSSVGNIYTGDYRTSASGGARNTQTGAAAVGGKVTRGNAYTGQQVTAGGVAVRNPNTGEITTAGGISGNNVGVGHIGDTNVARVGDDLYVGKDGEVARRTGDGTWQKQGSNGSWSNVDQSKKPELDKAQHQRQEGQRRYNGYAGGGHRAAGFGGRRR
jgi:hypothetical protein